METLYIGAKFEIGNIRYSDKSQLAEPYVVLYNSASKKIFVATLEDNGDNSYYAYIAPEESINVLPGVYALEIYTDSSKEEILKHVDDYVRAVKAASSETQS